MTFEGLRSAALTDVGNRRPNNEDALIVLQEHGVFCVADGMGGQVEGEVASKAVVDALRRVFSEARGTEIDNLDLSRESLQQASRWIHKRSIENGTPGTGTTAVALTFEKNPLDGAAVLHAGDSRVYRMRDKGLKLCTVDHSVATLAGVSSEDVLPAIFRGMVTRAVGVQDTVELEKTSLDVEKGDIFLICSDGLTRMIPDPDLEAIISSASMSSEQDVRTLAEDLISEANRRGGDDNITVILVQVAA